MSSDMSFKDKIKGAFSSFLALKYLGKKPVTLQIPNKMIRFAARRYRGFHANDWSKCVGCASCARVCPARAIDMVMVQGQRRPLPRIDYGRCCFCDLCVDVCPTGSLQATRIYELAEPDYRKFKIVPIAEIKLFEDKIIGLPIKEVIEEKGGWVTYVLADGRKVKFRIMGTYRLLPLRFKREPNVVKAKK